MSALERRCKLRLDHCCGYGVHIQELHRWDVSPSQARAIQEELRGRLRLADEVDPQRLRLVAGVDNAYARTSDGTIASAAAVVLDLPALEIVESAVASRPVEFPYVPGLLAFREAPAVLEVLQQIKLEPDVVLFDGQGYAHPRRFGLASHLGVVLGRPTIGCAKTRLIGQYQEPAREVGSWTPLVDGDEVVGAAVRTRPSHSPLFVSPGDRITVETAVRVVLACCRSGRFMPEPTREAHRLVTRTAHPERGGA